MSAETAETWRARPVRPSAGRPKVARNKATPVAEALLEQQIEAIVQTLIDRALDGNIAASCLFLDRAAPQDRDRVAFDLPELRASTDIVDALVAAVAAGQIAPREAERGMAMIVQRGDRLAKPASAAMQAEIVARVQLQQEQRETAERRLQAEAERLAQDAWGRSGQDLAPQREAVAAVMAAPQAVHTDIYREIQPAQPLRIRRGVWFRPARRTGQGSALPLKEQRKNSETRSGGQPRALRMRASDVRPGIVPPHLRGMSFGPARRTGQGTALPLKEQRKNSETRSAGQPRALRMRASDVRPGIVPTHLRGVWCGPARRTGQGTSLPLKEQRKNSETRVRRSVPHPADARLRRPARHRPAPPPRHGVRTGSPHGARDRAPAERTARIQRNTLRRSAPRLTDARARSPAGHRPGLPR